MRKLKAEEIECRVAQVTSKGCSLLLYKTARVDRAILDEEFGVMNWQNDFKVIDGKMYGGIGILSNGFNECWKDNPQWIWRWDCGTESNTEAEKGQASDCFKRAGFKWGIGVELYTAPFIFIQCDTVKEGSKYTLVNKYVKYSVQEIGYSDNGDINKLKIIDDKKNVVFEMGKYIEPTKDKVKLPKKPEKKLPSDKDMEFYEVIASMDKKEDLEEYYKNTCEQVDDRKAYHTLVCERLKAIKEVK